MHLRAVGFDQEEVIYVIEGLQPDGKWEPVAAPDSRPFTVKAAQTRLEQIVREYPFLNRREFRRRLRIVAYQRALIRWEQEVE